MKKAIVATIALFCGILVVCWIVADQAHPVMLDIDPAHQGHH